MQRYVFILIGTPSLIVTTLALGSRPRQGVARLQAKKETQESNHMLLGMPKSEGMNPHTPKWTPMLGVGVSNGFPNFQNAIAGVKTHHLIELFVSWKIIEAQMSKMGSHCPFGHLKHKLWPKERSGIKLAIWLSTSKSRESTRFHFIQAMCDIPLESFRWGLQLFFRLHCNRRSARQVMCLQNCESPGYGKFKTPIWESRDKKPFGCGPHGELQSIL
jgi:hypothetical protein